MQRVWNVLNAWCTLPSADAIQPDLRLDSLELDSLNLLEIELGLNKEFGITIAADEVSKADTVADLVALVEINSKDVKL